MAEIFPSGWNDVAVSGAAQREIETLRVLHNGLPNAYTVYHGVHWTQLNKGFALFGEADFVVVSPSGRVLVIEQKSGMLEETSEGLVKLYLGKSKRVAAQIARTIAGMHARFSAAFGANHYRLEEMLYCPDYRVKQAAIAGVNPSRIVDATRRDSLCTIIQQILPADEPPLPCAPRIHAFLADELSLTPDAGALAGEATRWVTRVSGGLATWARAIECRPFRLRVIGTAGSGKTQLAVRVLEDVAKAGGRALYVCYNRPLADHVRLIVPDSTHVLTYHQLCERVARPVEGVIDFHAPGAFARMESALAQHRITPEEQFDTIIVDEGQDFQQSWLDALQPFLKVDGRFWWLEDPMQNLYLREPVSLQDWVEVRALANYRSPRDIVRFLGQVAGDPMQIEAASPIGTSDVALVTYAGSNAVTETREALADMLKLGFAASDIAILTFQGRERSFFSMLDRLGNHSLCSFTGEYDANGAPVYRAGEIRFESVYRFKGQCAPCVILTEVDFETFDESALRRLFVGATRATLKLCIVMSERSAAALLARFA